MDVILIAGLLLLVGLLFLMTLYLVLLIVLLGWIGLGLLMIVVGAGELLQGDVCATAGSCGIGLLMLAIGLPLVGLFAAPITSKGRCL